MWDGGSNWGFWPMHQSAYSNLPSDQVDWAMLAKQWITQRGMVGMMPDYSQLPGAAAPLPPLPPVKPEQPAHPIGEVSSAVGGVMAKPHPQSMINCDMENSNSQDSNYYPSSEPDQPPSEGWNNWNGAAMPAWAVPPPPPPMVEAQDNIMNEMPYVGDAGQFMGPPFGFNQPPEDMYMGPYEHAGFPQFWNQGPMPGQPMMAQKPFGPVRENLEYRAAPKRGGAGVRAAWSAMGEIPPLMDDSGIDAAKRRHLPLWIREGLEKMEREKQRQMEKERHEQALQDAKKALEEAQRDGVDENGPPTVVKSIFDSDDEEPAAEPNVIHQSPVSSSVKNSGVSERKRSPSPIKRPVEEEEEEEEEPMTEEEKLAHMMLKVRQMMTEVFLEVTNREMADVAQTVYASEKRKQARAPARQLAKSTALDSLTSLGLGYESESSDEDGSDDERRLPNEESDDTDDDVVLRQRILQKKANFERKMQEMEENERENEMEKRRHAEEHLKPQKIDRDAESNDEAPVPVVDTAAEAPSRKDKENAGKRVKQNENRAKKDEKGPSKRSRSDRKERSKKVEEEEEEETSEETSESGSDSSSESGSSDNSSSSTSRSKKSLAESKELNRARIKSQVSDGSKERRKEKSDTERKKTDERDVKASRRDSGASRKEVEKQRNEHRMEEYQKEEKHSRKKSSRHQSEEKTEYDKVEQKRRRSTKDDERLRPDDTVLRRGQTEKTEDRDKTRGHKDSRGHRKRSRDDQSRSEDDDRRDYPTKTCDDNDRMHRSQHKKAKCSRSSSQSSHDHYRSHQSRNKESSSRDQKRSVKERDLPDQYRERRASRDRGQQSSRDRRSSRDRDRQSSRDQDRRKATKDRSGKKDRARGRSRSHSRSDDS